jgi:hypothetical protein
LFAPLPIISNTYEKSYFNDNGNELMN